MMHSMTAFGRGMNTAGDMTFTVEMRAVNGRYLDVSCRMPRSLLPLEERVKSYVQSSVTTRGKVDVNVTLTREGVSDKTVALDTAYADAYMAALRALRDRYALPDDITVMSVAKSPDVFTYTQTELDADAAWEALRPALAAAGEAFSRMRRAEGEKIQRDLYAKLDSVAAWVDEVERLSASDTSLYRDKLEARLRAVLSDQKITVDENRLLTECALFADRIAVDEEITRLRAHIGAFHEIAEEPVPAGKKLDFLMQEMNRETNTIGSKCADAAIARIVVNVKNELEKIREQVQNIE